MAIGDFDLFYSDEPFSIMDKNQRNWYDPVLMDVWRQRSVYRPVITFTKNNGAVTAKTMTVSQVLDPHADTTPLAMRQLWMESMHIDSRSIEITFQHNGLKIAYHKYDDMITYWKKDNVQGIERIARGALGVAQTDLNDMLARNALIGGSFTTGYQLYSGNATDFGDIATTDLFDPKVGSDIWLGMTMRGVPGAMNPSGAGGTMICFTSPGVIYDIQENEGWVSANEYLQKDILLNYEVGTYKNVRYVQTPKAVLFNCGALIAQAPISVAATAGDGAPDPASTKVDGTYLTGQASDGITHYIQLGTFGEGAITDLSVNDIITLHKSRTSTYGVTNGVNFQEGTLMNRRIVSIDVDNGRIVLDQPILVDFNTDLGGGVFGYVTKGTHVHSSVFVGGPRGIVAGVAQQPQLYTPPAIDDFMAIHRFSFDQYMGYQPFSPEVFEVVFSAGSMRYKGARAVQ